MKELSCIIVGTNEQDIDTVSQNYKLHKNYSGAYDCIVSNTVSYQGKRISYMALLNKLLAQVNGRSPNLNMNQLPHLGAAYLKSYIEKTGLSVEIINFFNAETNRFADLLQSGPKSVAITTTFYNSAEPISEIVRFVRKYNPKVKIIVGGPHIYNMFMDYDISNQDFLFDEMGADYYICDSQGESVLAGLVSALQNNPSEMSPIPNLVYRQNSSWMRTERKVENNSLDENDVNWSLFDNKFYTPTVQTRTSRSCPFSCAFCRYPIIAGPHQTMSIDAIKKQLKCFSDAGVENVIFVDDSFNVPLQRFKEICRVMIENNYKFKWFSYFRGTHFDKETFDLMKESGCVAVFLGIESGDDQMLRNMNKKATRDQYGECIMELNSRGIFTFACFVIGFPGETEVTVGNTIDFLESFPPSAYRAEPYFHTEKVPIQNRAAEFGLEGVAFSWRHKSMDWKGAVESVKRIYRSVTKSSILPITEFDAWCFPYLLGKGMSVELFTSFIKGAQEMLIKGLDSDAVDITVEEANLLSLFRTAGWDPPPKI